MQRECGCCTPGPALTDVKGNTTLLSIPTMFKQLMTEVVNISQVMCTAQNSSHKQPSPRQQQLEAAYAMHGPARHHFTLHSLDEVCMLQPPWTINHRGMLHVVHCALFCVAACNSLRCTQPAGFHGLQHGGHQWHICCRHRVVVQLTWRDPGQLLPLHATQLPAPLAAHCTAKQDHTAAASVGATQSSDNSDKAQQAAQQWPLN